MTTWHADDRLLDRYATGGADDVVAASIEAHLVACATCRSRLHSHVPPSRLAANWDELVLTLDAPKRGWVERTLSRLGVPAGTARLLAATESLRWSWLASVGVALGFAVLATLRPWTGGLVFLLAAPLVPLAGVTVAFNRSLDPVAEITEATPSAGLRLVFLRTIASVIPGMALAAAGGYLVGRAAAPVATAGAAWLLPALALSALSLLFSSLAPIGRVAAALGSLWAAVALATEVSARGSLRALRAGGAPESLLFAEPAQATAAVVALLATAATAVLARRQIDPWRPS